MQYVASAAASTMRRHRQQLRRDDATLPTISCCCMGETQAGHPSPFLLCFLFTHTPYYLPEH